MKYIAVIILCFAITLRANATNLRGRITHNPILRSVSKAYLKEAIKMILPLANKHWQKHLLSYSNNPVSSHSYRNNIFNGFLITGTSVQ